MPTNNPFTDQPNTWWDPDGPFWTLHAINPLRYDYIQKHAQLKGDALDVGCGGGILSESLQEHYSVVGIDLDEKLIEIAKSRKSNIEYHHKSTADIVNEHKEHFDLITCLEVLEHVEHPKDMIFEISAMLKPGGRAFFSTLNRNPVSFLGAIVAAEYILRILPKRTHQYQDFIKPSELIRWCNEAGLQLVDMQGIHYNPLNKTFFMAPSTIINYITCFQKQIA